MVAQTRRAALAVLFLLVVALLLAAAEPRVARADPAVGDNLDGTLTASWAFENAANYSSSGSVEMQPQRLMLAENKTSVAFEGASSLAGNGTADGNLTSMGDWLRLRGNEASWVPDGNFSDPGPWNYLDGAQGRLHSSWSSGHGRFNHSQAQTWRSYESMDAPDPFSWLVFATGGSLSYWSVDTGDRIQGSASMRNNVSLVSGGYGGVYNSTSTPWDFSPFDSVHGWFKAHRAGLNMSLVLDLPGGPQTVGTAAVPTSWTDLGFNITSLGTNRSSVSRFELRFSGGLGFFSVHIDSLQLVASKEFTEVALMSQSLAKGWDSSPALGSSVLSFGLNLVTRTNIATAFAGISIASGPTVLFERRIDLNTTGEYPLDADVSAAVATAGSYTLSLNLTMHVNSFLQTDADLWVDNVTMLSPGFHPGKYTTAAIEAGSPANWGTVNWTAAAPSETSVVVRTRTGSTANPADGTWSAWVSHANAGGEPIGSPADRYVQVEVDLGTTNESRTPSFHGLALTYGQYGLQGAVATWPFRPGENLLGWIRFEVDFVQPPTTSVRFFIEGDTPWAEIHDRDGLGGLSLGNTTQLRIELATTNTSRSPTVSAMRVVYGWRGPLAQIVVDPNAVQLKLGENQTFAITGLDAYDHAVPFDAVWSTDDPSATIEMVGNAWVYTPGSVGTSHVRVSTTDGRITATVVVFVNPASPTPPTNVVPPTDFSWIYVVLGGAAAAGAAALLGWERLFRFRRRMEDLFLIGKDGRLLLHTTLQLHPDRDEDLLAGMLTAVTAFVRDSFRDADGNGSDLKTAKIGDAKVLVERGEHFYAAAIFRPLEPPWAPKDLAAFVRDVEVAYGDAIRDWSGDPADLHGLRAFTDEFVRSRRYRNHRRVRSPRPAA